MSGSKALFSEFVDVILAGSFDETDTERSWDIEDNFSEAVSCARPYKGESTREAYLRACLIYSDQQVPEQVEDRCFDLLAENELSVLSPSHKQMVEIIKDFYESRDQQLPSIVQKIDDNDGGLNPLFLASTKE